MCVIFEKTPKNFLEYSVLVMGFSKVKKRYYLFVSDFHITVV